MSIKQAHFAWSPMIIVVFTICILCNLSSCKDQNTGVNSAQPEAFLAEPTPITIPPIVIQSTVPADLPKGAANSTLADAAAFAWQEFIALSWPAVPQTGKLNTRDTPDNSRKFGDGSGPIVWETYRHKVEVFPGPGNAPNGYTPSADQDYGYDALPAYQYVFPVPPCSGTASKNSAFINLDEISQIGLNEMSTGVTAGIQNGKNSEPTLIRFLAKANRTQYEYIASNNYWDFGGNYYTAVTNFTNAINSNGRIPDKPIITFPSGTIETKAAWRLLTAEEAASGTFYTTSARYYESKTGGGNEGQPKPCYYQDNPGVWGLVALHIMHKTPSAPYFTFATFEQSSNILTSDGKPVEDANGNVINTPTGSGPTTPGITYEDPFAPNIGNNPGVHIDSGSTYIAHSEIGKELYYKNTVNGLPSDGLIRVNQRANPIPATIINANKTAHQAIDTYNQTNNIKNSPWTNYKLVNIQWRPFNQSDISSDPEGVNNKATYYQANIVVETNNTLQTFTGAQVKVQPGIIGPKTVKYQGVKTSYALGQDSLFRNVHVPGANGFYNEYSMGGCMGCHGNAQAAGADFSFILFFGPNRFPEYPEPDLKIRNIFKTKYGGGITSNVQVH